MTAKKSRGCFSRAGVPLVDVIVSPRATEPLRGMALVLRERGRLNEALHSLSTAHAIKPGDPQLRLDVGITHDYAERREEAERRKREAEDQQRVREAERRRASLESMPTFGWLQIMLFCCMQEVRS